ncbi:hypothetical protein QQF64_036142 [Cirrhinus molitorella]|uniref:ATP-dependent DNA helicase n=1 Tax=Cirrhinus molitorella TaxID=172907 RepID=A0ABR3NHW9_9TELE
MSLSLSALQNKDPDSEDVWMSGIIDKYRARPQTREFEKLCLADFASEYRIVYGQQTKAFAPEIDVDRLECIAERADINPDDENVQDDVPEYQILERGDGVVPQVVLVVASHVIKCIYTEATKILRQLPRLREEGDLSVTTVVLSAFTGTAAFNISGNTLHSILKLPQNLKPPYQGLGNALDELRARLCDVEILIIDEVSMISKDIFAYINWRFQQIKGSKKPFGGISVLAVGDFYQLPPTGKAKPLCVYEEGVLDFWKDHFQMITLSDVMRQKKRPCFCSAFEPTTSEEEDRIS